MLHGHVTSFTDQGPPTYSLPSFHLGFLALWRRQAFPIAPFVFPCILVPTVNGSHARVDGSGDTLTNGQWWIAFHHTEPRAIVATTLVTTDCLVSNPRRTGVLRMIDLCENTVSWGVWLKRHIC